MLTKSRQSLCHVAWTLVPAVGSALVCQSKHPGQPCGIVFINVALDKCRHSKANKKKHYVLQVLSHKHWDKTTCSNTYDLW